MEIAGEPFHLQRLRGQVGLLRLDFLQAGDIGFLPGKPGEKPLCGRRTDTVNIGTDDTHGLFLFAKTAIMMDFEDLPLLRIR
jgi:hypothetical protein